MGACIGSKMRSRATSASFRSASRKICDEGAAVMHLAAGNIATVAKCDLVLDDMFED
jgi:hypothetical protein